MHSLFSLFCLSHVRRATRGVDPEVWCPGQLPRSVSPAWGAVLQSPAFEERCSSRCVAQLDAEAARSPAVVGPVAAPDRSASGLSYEAAFLEPRAVRGEVVGPVGQVIQVGAA